MEVALYGPSVGFFASGHGAGRAGRDFVTSPEVGSLFGACVARALDRSWRELDEPDPFLVIEAGAGNGRLARDIARAEPDCAPALHYVLVERSATLREEQRDRLRLEPADEALGPFTRASAEDSPTNVGGSGPVFVSLEDLPALEVTGVVLANELLDNLPFGIAEWTGSRWDEVRIATDASGDLGEVLVPAVAADSLALAAISAGAELVPGGRLPIPRGLDAWLAACSRVLHRGTLVAIDYVDSVGGVIERGAPSWLRTYREHDRGSDPLDEPGNNDITADVVREQLLRSARASGFTFVSESPQSEWLETLGIADLAEEGRRTWESRAHLGDLVALAGRSRVTEASALTDTAGLGAHRVVTLSR